MFQNKHFEIQDILNRTREKEPTHWSKTLKQYYYRPEWEFYDLRKDAEEVKNVVGKPAYKVRQFFNLPLLKSNCKLYFEFRVVMNYKF